MEQKTGMVCMSYITLLGDSIIDNKTYVQKGELSVLEHLENVSEYEYTQLAFDGDTTLNVLNGQLLSPAIATSSHLVLSIGGNDLLQNLSFLYEGPVDKINDAVAGVQQYIFKPLEQRFETIIQRLSSIGQISFYALYMKAIWEELMNLEMY